MRPRFSADPVRIMVTRLVFEGGERMQSDFFVSEVLALHGKVKSKNCDRIISSGIFVGVKRPARPALC